MRRVVFVMVAVVMLGASRASAQSATPTSSPEDWQVEVVPYLWGSGIDGPVGVGSRTADLDASFCNILSHLHFAAMGLADARRDKLVVLTDASTPTFAAIARRQARCFPAWTRSSDCSS